MRGPNCLRWPPKPRIGRPMSKRDDPHGPVLPDACNAMYDGFRDKLRSIPARPPVGDTTQPQPTDEPPRCDCGLPAASGSNFCSDCLPACRHGNVLAAVSEIRALHRPHDMTHTLFGEKKHLCCHCENQWWPCATIALLDRAGCP